MARVDFCRTGIVVALVFVLVGGVPRAIAGEVTDADRLDVVQAVLDSQRARLAQLEHELAAQEDRSLPAQRNAALREQIRAVLSEPAFREDLVPTLLQAGYDNGFFIQSTDNNFKLRLNAYMQFRWTHYATQSDNRYLLPRFERDDRTGFGIQRIRMIFRGHAFDPDLTYYLQLRAGDSQAYEFTIRDAFLNYAFSDAFQIRAGIFKVPGTLSRWTSASKMQFPDRPMYEAVFSLNRGLGVQFWGELFEQRLEYALSVTNSWTRYPNRTITPDPAQTDSNPALALRVVWNVLGDNPAKDLADEPDLKYLETPAMFVAFHYGFNEDDGDRTGLRLPVPITNAQRGVGAFGQVTSRGLQIHRASLQSAFKYRGFSARGEYIAQFVDVRNAGRRPFAPWWRASRQGDTTVQHGAYVQAGYFLPIPGMERQLELVGRVGGISAAANEQDAAWEYTAGLNYYFKEHDVKLQADVTRVTEVPVRSSNSSLANVNDDALIFRMQLQFGF